MTEMMSFFQQYQDHLSLDESKIQQLVQLGEEIGEDVLGQLTEVHVHATDELVRELPVLYQQQRFDELVRVAHKFKSSCGNLGLTKLHHLCADFEKQLGHFIKIKSFDRRVIQNFVDCITYEVKSTTQQLQSRQKVS